MRVAVITAEVVLEQKKGQRVRNPASGLPSPAHGAGAGPQVPILQEGPQPRGGVAPGRTRAPQPYHSVLVLLRGIVHSRVPHVGVGGVHLARIQLPVPGKREQIPSVIPWLCCCSPATFFALPSRKLLEGLRKKAASGAQGTAPFETSTCCRNQHSAPSALGHSGQRNCRPRGYRPL